MTVLTTHSYACALIFLPFTMRLFLFAALFSQASTRRNAANGGAVSSKAALIELTGDD